MTFEFPNPMIASNFVVNCIQYPALSNIAISAKILRMRDKTQVRVTVLENKVNLDLINRMIGQKVNLSVRRWELNESEEEGFDQIDRVMECISSESAMDYGSNSIGTSVILFEAEQ